MIIKAVFISPEDLTSDLEEVAHAAASIAMQRLAHVVEHNWIKMASQKLKTSFSDYQRSLSVEGTDEGLGYDFSIEGFLPHAVEFGLPPFDMKQTFLWQHNFSGGSMDWTSATTGVNVKQGKNGPYIIIPFRWATTSKPSAKSFLQVDKQALRGIQILQRIRSAKTAGASDRAVAQYKKWNQTEGLTGKLKFNKRTQLWGGVKYKKGLRQTVSHTGYISKVGKAENLRYHEKYKYTTMRTVSTKSAPRSWIHSGIRARLLHEAVIRNIPNMIDQEFGPVMTTLFGSGKV